MQSEARRCDVCEGPLGNPPEFGLRGVRDPQTGEAFDIVRCTQCGLGHTAPQPENLGDYYGPAYHGGRHGFTEGLCLARRLRMLRAVAPHPGRLLDFGCGDGGFILAAMKAGWSAQGVEIVPAHARARGLDVVEEISQTKGPFELITLWHSLEHARSPRGVLRELMEKLAPGGRVIVGVPNAASLQARAFGAAWVHLDVPRHLFHFTPAALERLLAEVGLVASARWDLEVENEVFGWTQSALNRVLPTPNVLYDAITHRAVSHGRREVAASLVLGSMAAAASLAVAPLTARSARGSTMVFAAQLSPGTGRDEPGRRSPLGGASLRAPLANSR